MASAFHFLSENERTGGFRYSFSQREGVSRRCQALPTLPFLKVKEWEAVSAYHFLIGKKWTEAARSSHKDSTMHLYFYPYLYLHL